MSKRDPYEGRTREGYLESLAEEFDLPLDLVLNLAYLLGPDEDFDGLISELHDIVEVGEW